VIRTMFQTGIFAATVERQPLPGDGERSLAGYARPPHFCSVLSLAPALPTERLLLLLRAYAVNVNWTVSICNLPREPTLRSWRPLLPFERVPTCLTAFAVASTGRVLRYRFNIGAAGGTPAYPAPSLPYAHTATADATWRGTYAFHDAFWLLYWVENSIRVVTIAAVSPC